MASTKVTKKAKKHHQCRGSPRVEKMSSDEDVPVDDDGGDEGDKVPPRKNSGEGQLRHRHKKRGKRTMVST